MAKIEVFKESCKSCGYCVKYCPGNVIKIGTDVNQKGYQYLVADKMENCIGCKICASICPDAAIEVYK